MAKLWDRIHRSHSPVPLSGTEAFDVSNVLRMFWEGPDDVLDWDKLPNVAPPFRSYFMFGSAPIMRVGGHDTVLPSLESEMGVLFRSAKSSRGWSVACAFVGGREPTWQQLALMYRVGHDGRIEDRGGKPFAVAWSQNMTWLAERGLTEADVVAIVSGLAYPFLLATSILHCKNVVAQRVRLPEKRAKAAARRGRPLYSYSILDVTPIRKTLVDDGGFGRGSSLAKALHVCRGHFKDYRDGAGLFGRFRGVYWWEQSLRGDVVAGVHIKDYRVGRSPTIGGL